MNNEQLTELLRRLEHEWAPELLNLAARIVFWDAVGWLIIGGVLASLTILGLRFAVKMWRLGKEDSDDIYVMTFCVTSLLSALSGVFALLILFNIWNWIALFDPQLAVAKRVLDLATR